MLTFITFFEEMQEEVLVDEGTQEIPPMLRPPDDSPGGSTYHF